MPDVGCAVPRGACEVLAREGISMVRSGAVLKAPAETMFGGPGPFVPVVGTLRYADLLVVGCCRVLDAVTSLFHLVSGVLDRVVDPFAGLLGRSFMLLAA